MTAEVAVLNSLGVAIAADSAVTIDVGDARKTYYTQQKIFSLTKKHSVGIMIYSDSEFMQINWEIIINEFSKAVGDRVFDTLEEYAKYFLTFLSDFRYITDKHQKDYLDIISYFFFEEIKDKCDEDVSENYKDQEITKSQQTKILTAALKKTREILETETYSTGFVDDGFVSANHETILNEIKEVFADYNINEKTKEEMLELFLLDLVKIEIARWENLNSGIVFAGYGDKEIFPSVIDFHVFGKLGKNVLHNNFSTVDVIHDSNAWIAPYAQTDAINTFIRGIDPVFKDIISAEIDKFIDGVTKLVGKKYLEAIIKLKDEVLNKIQDYEEENYKGPVMNIVASLPKSDLAEMAEALVNITSLRRHVSIEAETVGGPTDVALISKVDGFVWIKRKQIIQTENQGAGINGTSR
ncbi:hypothetical protein FACS189476_06640 [Spirochaetia bacterium]|nr:hypothetical protein FACS189476_06640 [Spirochaetia bacterium]